MIGLVVAMAASSIDVMGAAEKSTREAIVRIEQIDPRIHAVIALDPTAIDQARALDRTSREPGPQHGVPLLTKDNIEMAGPLPTTAGSLALRDNVTGRDAPLVARLRAAGAVMLGKTNLSEWANMRSSGSISGWSAIGGQTRNPYALDRTPCGSSSGSAAAVAAGEVEAAIGTETDGSITCPASMNGVVGLKPTVGLVSRTHIVPISQSQDTAGPLASTVTMAARLLGAIAGSDPEDPATADADRHKADYMGALRTDALKGARIGVVRFAGPWSPAVEERFEIALTVLKAAGATLVDIADLKVRAEIGPNELTVLLFELKVGLAAYLATTPPAVEARTLADLIAFNKAEPRELALFGQNWFEAAEATKGLEDADYRRARATALQQAGREGIDALLSAHRLDVLVAPTMPPAWLIDRVQGDRVIAAGVGDLAAVSGYPHLSVPMGLVKGLPVGLSFIGPAWSEARLLGYGYGYGYEQAARIRIVPSFVPSLEDSSEIAPLMQPFRQEGIPH